MYLTEPRVAPVVDNEWTAEQRALLEPLAGRGPILNIFKTLAQYPDALAAFLSWGNFVLSRKNVLPAREREIVVLRIGFLCRAGYEWTQHVEIGKRCKLTDQEIARIKLGADAPGWTDAEKALLHASDELHQKQFISPTTWAALGEHFDEKQRMGVVFTAGQYTQVSMILNTFGVQLDQGQSLDPDLKQF